MSSVHKSVLIWYSARQMFDLVIDIPSYPKFLPWCDHASVTETHTDGVTAEVGIQFSGVRQQFSTRNVHVTPAAGPLEIRMALQDGPFSTLSGGWTFVPVGQDGMACRVELHLNYSFKNAALAALVGPVFDRIASSLVDAFVKRAELVYG